jgi:hypothetical protein
VEAKPTVNVSAPVAVILTLSEAMGKDLLLETDNSRSFGRCRFLRMTFFERRSY